MSFIPSNNHNEDVKVLILVEYGYLTIFLFSMPFKSIYHAKTFTSRQNGPGINMVQRMVLAQMITKYINILSR